MGESGFKRGQYMGEISALCFLPLPQLSRSPLLLAGTGSQMTVYDVEAGKTLNLFHVFEGIRVHGISCSFVDLANCASSIILAFKIAIYGERRVKLYSLHLEMTSDYHCSVEALRLTIIDSLPKFSHWVMDVCFFKEDLMSGEHVWDSHIAVGLSNNSLCLWDISSSSLVLEVKCSERCLLYSMRLWGHKSRELLIAAGTIYNEINVWKLVCESRHSSSLSSVDISSQRVTPCCTSNQLSEQQYEAVTLARLIGHEGSIFRIAWSSDGSKLMSVSDDRSARVWSLWTIGAQKEEPDGLTKVEAILSADLVLFGHNARVWDCCIHDSIFITAGEDCSCRVWGLDGNQIIMIKEHIGRGIWRCLYDPSSSLIITAGFDSTIKAHPAPASFMNTSDHGGSVNEMYDRTETFTVPIPNLPEQFGLMNSKSEYVRCLRFAREDTLYVATNHGRLHHVKLSVSDTGNPKWTELIHLSEEVAIICMDLLSTNLFDLPGDVDDWIAVGDGKGNTTVVGVKNCSQTPKVVASFTWMAEKERQLLGIYLCKSLGCRYLFTADPRGRLKLWRVDFVGTCMIQKAFLLAEFTSSFGIRIMSLDALYEEEVLACGDQRGNIILFPLSYSLLIHSIESDDNISSLAYFKGAHGISTVASILLATIQFNQVEICSTGGDGCICYFEYYKDSQGLEFMGMKQVKDLSLVQSVFANAGLIRDLAQGNYAIGFASTDFIIWHLVNNTKVLRVPCGGWRRPHSYFLGDTPETQSCFAYLKDQTIYVHRLWLPVSNGIPFPQLLHMQFHGREIHSLCFISFGIPLEDSRPALGLSWIATGCEDGTVRLTRYSPNVDSWSVSKLLGEHVGGSAVRSICFVTKIHISTEGQMQTPCNAAPNNRDDMFLLISVGAKRVLTSWLLRNKRQKEESNVDRMLTKSENLYDDSLEGCCSLSFQWLSTHMPPKFASARKDEHNSAQGRNVSMVETGDQNENDWRYLAVTAFLVKSSDHRLTYCFAVMACSDATLTLRALLLPHRLWFDVAVLASQKSPVLSLQHAVIPFFDPCEDKSEKIENTYIVISGSTDGSIAFWDLTQSVHCFIQRVSIVQPEKVIDCQRRPQTGRGSQGGRWWRSLLNKSSKSCSPLATHVVGIMESSDDHRASLNEHDSSEQQSNDCFRASSGSTNRFNVPVEDSDNSLTGVCELQPLYVVNSVHQSGVNCLHVSYVEDHRHFKSKSVCYVVSGGDDQALHCLVFSLALQQTNHGSGPTQPKEIPINIQVGMAGEPTGLDDMRKCSLDGWYKEYKIEFLSSDRISSAHCSALKGVWTDGMWVFSTGLDQRVRCWRLSRSGALSEHAHLVISVPEPETLDARACRRNQYQIAVGGRGMQMVEFFAPENLTSDD